MPAHRAYAAFLVSQGRRPEALAALDAGLAAAPGDGELIFAKAGLSEAAGDRAGALALYARSMPAIPARRCWPTTSRAC